MNLETFRLWKVKPLQDFLRVRGVKTSGTKDELVALVFACHIMDIPPQPSVEDNKKTLSKEYADLLFIDGNRLPDPFSELKTGWEDESVSARKKWPPTMYGDMIEFMAECGVPGQRRKKILSEYKDGKGYSYFASGFLQQVQYHQVCEGSKFCFLMAKATPSQNIRNVPHKAWVLIDKESGQIRSAYCTCMAGMLSQCNHVAAILFKVDWAWSVSEKSVTSNPCQWGVPSAKVVEPSKIANMTIYKPQAEKSSVERNINHAAKRLFSPQRSREDTPFTLDQWAGLLYDKQQDAVAFNYAVPHRAPVYSAEADLNVALEEEVETGACVPHPLPHVAKDFTSTNEFVDFIRQNPGDVAALEEATRDQTGATWREQRHGRIGASVAHMCKSRMATLQKKKGDHSSILKAVETVLGKGPDIGNLPAVKYGRLKEDEARRAYSKTHKELYKHDVNVSSSGLVVCEDRCYISASPDGLVDCDCGKGLVEIKCPLSGAGKAPGEHLAFLHKVNGKLVLKRSHAYFTQCQQQLGVTKRAFCDFFVYCGPGFSFTERIVPDPEFMLTSLHLLDAFFIQHVAPAMLALSHEMITATAVEAPKDVPQDPITVRTADNAPQPQDLTITVRTADNAPQVLLSVSVPVPDQGKCTTTSTVHLPTSIVKKKRTLRKKGQSHSQSNIYNCGTCFKLCLEVEDITQPDQESVGCDKCGVWFHCICVNFKDVSASKWYCPPCIIL